MQSILIVRLWYALSLFAIVFASPIVVQRQDGAGIPWPEGGFNVPIGSPKQSWYVFYNGTDCELPVCRSAAELGSIWLSMINQIISYLQLGTSPIRTPIIVHLPMPVTWKGHERAYMFGVLEPRRKDGAEREELLAAMLNLRQQVLVHVVFRRFLADIYQGWRDLSATVIFGARWRDVAAGNGSSMIGGWDPDAMNGSTTILNPSPATIPSLYPPSTDVTDAVQVTKRAPASNVSEDLPPWPIGKFRVPIGTSEDSWFNTYEATGAGTDDPRRRDLWTQLCNAIIQDMLDSRENPVTKGYSHEAQRFPPSPSEKRYKVLFSPADRGIDKDQVIAAMENIKELIGRYGRLAILEVWMYEGQHDGRAYSSFYQSFPPENAPNSSSILSLPSDLVGGLQNVSSSLNADPIPAVDVT